MVTPSVSDTLHSPVTRRRAGKLNWGYLVLAGVVILLLVLTLVPILYMFTTSLKEPIEIRRSGAVLPQEGVTLINWARAYRNVPLHRYLFNSTFVAVASSALAILIGLPASYVIARFAYGGKVLPAWILGTYITPPIVISLPVFAMMRGAGLVDSKIGLTIVHAVAALPVAVWLLDSFVRRIPKELDEAALLDGASRHRILWQVIAPLILPGLIATFIIGMILSWNEFLFALILTYSERSQTFPIGISNYIGEHGQQFGEMSAAALTGLMPVYLLAFFFQRYLVQGLSEGGVKS